MRIFSKSKIAFNILLDIAAHTAQGRAISVPLVCRRHQLSHSYLEVIFGQLRDAGFILSHRGPGGGYSLAKKPEDISLYDVLSLMNGQEPLYEDLGVSLWANLDAYMDLQMKQITLSDALQRSSIVLEQSTQGLGQVRLNAAPKIPVAAKSKKEPQKLKPRLGPNSVFSFGEYLKSKA